MSFWEALIEHVGEYFRRRAVIYALVIALLGVGMASGAVAVGDLSEADQGELSRFLHAYVSRTSTARDASPGGGEAGVWEGVARGALVPWLLGLTVIGAPVALVLVFLRGFAVGFTLKFLVDELSYRGIVLGLVSVAPHSLLTLFGLCLASGAAVAFAVSAAKVLAGRGDGEGVLGHFVTLTILTIAAAACVGAGTWIQAHVAPVLVDLVARWLSL